MTNRIWKRQYLFISIFLGLGFVTVACRVTDPADGIYLLPEGFTGGVVIFFDRPDGVMPEMEDGRYVYEIPRDGILKVRSSTGSRFLRRDYYYLSDDGTRRKVESLRITGDKDVNGQPQKMFGNISPEDYETKIFVTNAGGLGSFNTREGTIQFTSFIVGTPKNSTASYDELQNKITQIQRAFALND